MKVLVTPIRQWGIEFLAHEVRICGFRKDEEGWILDKSFAGSRVDAEAFAQSQDLVNQGVYAAVSTIPYKIIALESDLGSEDDLLPLVERVKPLGLATGMLDYFEGSHAGKRLLVLAREHAVAGFRETLPEDLKSLWELIPSPLALLPFIDLTQTPDRLAALLPEDQYVHILFFSGRMLESYVKVFVPLEKLHSDPAGYTREIKKALVYHYGARFLGTPLEALQIWKDSPDQAMAKALQGLAIPLVKPVWKKELNSVTDSLRVSAAMALRHTVEAYGSFTLPPNLRAESSRLWKSRTTRLLRWGTLTLLGAGTIVGMLTLAGLGMRMMVEMKSHTWASELGKWDTFRKNKVTVETRLGNMQGLLFNRTLDYAGLQRIAALMPTEMWMESWEIEAQSSGQLEHRLVGYAMQESRITEFLSKLEKSHFLAVKLKSTEHMPGDKVQKKTGIPANRKDLTRFQLNLSESGLSEPRESIK